MRKHSLAFFYCDLQCSLGHYLLGLFLWWMTSGRNCFAIENCRHLKFRVVARREIHDGVIKLHKYFEIIMLFTIVSKGIYIWSTVIRQFSRNLTCSLPWLWNWFNSMEGIWFFSFQDKKMAHLYVNWFGVLSIFHANTGSSRTSISLIFGQYVKISGWWCK